MPVERKNSDTDLVVRWKVALANAGLRQATWAEQIGVTESHVSQVVSGKRDSSIIMEQIRRFIDEQERLIAQRVSLNVVAA